MFKSRDYISEEEFDIAKFMPFVNDTYDVLNSNLLNSIKDLPVVSYYNTSEGHRDIDLISLEIYDTVFMSFYIQYYNDINCETLPEDYTLRLFSLNDFNNLCGELLINGI